MNYQRHDLVWLDPAGNYSPALASWVMAGYPCIIPRQDAGLSGLLRVAWSLPRDKSASGRLLQTVPLAAVASRQSPLALAHLSVLVASAEFDEIIQQLRVLDINVGLYGSFAWQLLTKQHYIHEQSDIDILISVNNFTQLKILPPLLEKLAQICQRRIDGEIIFPDGSAVAWREWFSPASQLLVKTLYRVELIDRESLCAHLI